MIERFIIIIFIYFAHFTDKTGVPLLKNNQKHQPSQSQQVILSNITFWIYIRNK